jgi:hypothetical protein
MRLFKKQQETVQAPEAACAHGVMVARWDRLEDMGNENLVSHYQCEACGETFTPMEAQHIQENHVEHIRAS